MIGKQIHVLLIEDDDVDAEMVYRATRFLGSLLKIVRAVNASNAISILHGTEGYKRLPRPYIIVMDLNLPGITGIEFLEKLRSDSQLAESIVFVLTGSSMPTLRREALNHGVVAFVSKSQFFNHSQQLMVLLLRYLENVGMVFDD